MTDSDLAVDWVAVHDATPDGWYIAARTSTIGTTAGSGALTLHARAFQVAGSPTSDSAELAVVGAIRFVGPVAPSPPAPRGHPHPDEVRRVAAGDIVRGDGRRRVRSGNQPAPASELVGSQTQPH